jgi:ribosomal protein L37AE/L43A
VERDTRTKGVAMSCDLNKVCPDCGEDNGIYNLEDNIWECTHCGAKWKSYNAFGYAWEDVVYGGDVDDEDLKGIVV